MMPIDLPVGIYGGLRSLSRAERCTLFMTLLAALQSLLSRYSSHEEVVVGSAIAGRDRPELEPLIGFFVNMLAMRIDLCDALRPAIIAVLQDLHVTGRLGETLPQRRQRRRRRRQDGPGVPQKLPEFGPVILQQGVKVLWRRQEHVLEGPGDRQIEL